MTLFDFGTTRIEIIFLTFDNVESLLIAVYIVWLTIISCKIL